MHLCKPCATTRHEKGEDLGCQTISRSKQYTCEDCGRKFVYQYCAGGFQKESTNDIHCDYPELCECRLEI